MAIRRAVFALALLSGSFACERTDTDRNAASGLKTSSSTPPTTTPPTAAAAEPARAKRAPGCVVPLPDSPPPEAALAADCPVDLDGPPTLPRGRVRFVEAPGKPAVDVELARSDAHRQRGLMYRTSMPDDDGMLFSWSNETIRSFWMRNTCIPLDMLFIAADGTIVGVLENVPTLNETPRRIPCPAAHVLEVNAGWSRAHGVKPGQRIEIDS